MRYLLICILLAACGDGGEPKPMLICQKDIQCSGEPRSCRAVNVCLPK